MIGGAPLTLEDLSTEVEALLRRRGLAGAHADGRVSPVPNGRTIRYYTTLGLIDRPEIVAREARYGRRHVLQVVAIKALQTAGRPLEEIQTRLYGLSNDELEALLAADFGTPRRKESVRSITWREVVIEPGLKVLVQDGWASETSPEELGSQIAKVLSTLIQNGGA